MRKWYYKAGFHQRKMRFDLQKGEGRLGILMFLESIQPHSYDPQIHSEIRHLVA